MSQVKRLLSRVFRRGHPDIYQGVKVYAEKKGVSMSDVIAAACSGYLASDEDEGKELLEQAMSERRTGGGRGGMAGIDEALKVFDKVCTSMGTFFTTMNTARAGMQKNAIISDFKAAADAVSEVKKIGGESGSGSLEDTLATAFINNLLGGRVNLPKRTRKKLGSSKVEEIGAD